MPVTYRIDREARLVRAEVEGELSLLDMLQAVIGAASEAGESGYGIVSDHRRIAVPATREQLETLTGQLAAMPEFFRDSRWAVVTDSPASYGMMRVFSVFAERVPMQVEVFTSMEEAERWARGAT